MIGREAGGLGRATPADVEATDCPGAMPGASTVAATASIERM